MAEAKDEKNVSKEPDEKSWLEDLINDLLKELSEVDLNLEREGNCLNSLKNHRNNELENKEACISHLQKTLSTKIEECEEEQKQFHLAEDMKELTETRAADLRKNLDQKLDFSKSLFSQQKSDLEGKLSLLEEKRLKKNSEEAQLERLEQHLKENLAKKFSEDRKRDKIEVSRLLEKRKHFEVLVDSLCSDSEEVFKLSLPVHAKQQLCYNIRLRSLCEEASEKVLLDQERSRHLTKLQKSLNIESESQDIIEAAVKSLKSKFNVISECCTNFEDNLRQRDEERLEVDRDIEKLTLENKVQELCVIADELSDLYKILEDQKQYKEALEEKIAEKIDSNGEMMSAILTAEKVLNSRVNIVKDKENNFLSCELLKQIRIILDLNLSTKRIKERR